jgi:hypothetical protein
MYAEPKTANQHRQCVQVFASLTLRILPQEEPKSGNQHCLCLRCGIDTERGPTPKNVISNEASSVHSDVSVDSSPNVSCMSAWLATSSSSLGSVAASWTVLLLFLGGRAEDVDLPDTSPLLLNLRRRVLPYFASLVLSLTSGRRRGTMPKS